MSRSRTESINALNSTAPAASIRWLHLSDLHAGCRGQSNMHQLLEELRRDIRLMAPIAGPPDLILFTGDLANTGQEYQQVGQILDLIHSWLREAHPAAPAPLLFAVPGNHDMVRPTGDRKLACRVLRDFDNLADADVRTVRKELWEDANPGLVEPMFARYTAWMREQIVAPLAQDSQCEPVSTSFFPGDLSTVIVRNDFRLGLVGLNSAWIQYDGGDFEGKLHLTAEQLHAALSPRTPLTFFEETDAALLLMHHPPAWLSPAAREVFDHSVYPPERFDLCLFGHVHAGRSEVVAVSGAAPRAYFQAHSLFGLEHYGTAQDSRTFGYAWGEIARNGGIRVWPRIRVRRGGGQWAFDRDQQFEDHGDGAVWLRRPERPASSPPSQLRDSDATAEPRHAAAEPQPAPADRPACVVKPAVVDFEAVLVDYARWAGQEHRRLDLGNLAGGHPCPTLDEVFVPPRICMRSAGTGNTHAGEDAHEMTLLDAFAQMAPARHMFLLGPPGSGKTTALKSLAWTMLDQLTSDQEAGQNENSTRAEVLSPGLASPRGMVPVFVPVRYLDAWDPSRPLADFLDAYLAKLDGVAIPEGFGRWLWQRGRLLLLLDGLNEIGVPERRQAVCRYVEQQLAHAKAQSIPHICAAMSSRGSGSTLAAEPLHGFAYTDILPLEYDQSEALITRWFEADERMRVQDGREAAALARARARCAELMACIPAPEHMDGALRSMFRAPQTLLLFLLSRQELYEKLPSFLQSRRPTEQTTDQAKRKGESTESSPESERTTRATLFKFSKPDAEQGDACLVLIYPPGSDMGRRFLLSQGEVMLGRGADCDIQVDRDSVSRRHARVSREGNFWVVEDLGSTNGSYVNDRPVQSMPLRDSDYLKIGSAIFKFLSGESIEYSYYEEIYRMTIMDGLTGAYNKRYLIELLERELVRCARHQRPLSLLMFDIDHFKHVNDTHGHLTGDHLLKEIARRVLSHVREEEILSRYGGEEFAVVLPELDHQGALDFAEQIRQIVGTEPFEYEGDRITVTVSVGVCTLAGQAVDPLTFIRCADDNLYRAKREGRNRVVGMRDAPSFQARTTGADVSGLDQSGRDQASPDEGLLGARERDSQALPEGATREIVSTSHRGSASRLLTTRIYAHKPLQILPDRVFRHELQNQGVTAVLAVDIVGRDKIAAQEGGPAKIQDLNEAIELAVACTTNEPALVLGRLDSVNALFIGLAGRSPEEADRLARDIERFFEEERFRRELANARIVCGRAVPFGSAETTLQQAVASLIPAQNQAKKEEQMPLPIAWAARNAAAQIKPNEAISALFRLHETICGCLATLLLAELLAARDTYDLYIPALGELLDEHATLGRWQQITHQIAAFLVHQPAEQARFPGIARALYTQNGQPTEATRILDELPAVRERLLAGHEEVQAWKAKIQGLLDGPLRHLQQIIPLHIVEMDIDELDDTQFRYSVQRLVGDHLAIMPTPLLSKHRMGCARVYATDDAQSAVLCLDPLVVYSRPPENVESELFFLSSTRDDSLLYKSIRSEQMLENPVPWTEAKRRAIARLRKYAAS